MGTTNKDYQSNEKNSFLEKNIGKILFVLSIAALSIGAWVAYQYYSVFSGPRIAQHELWGQFGDYIGGTLNPIFAFFGLLALLVTIVYQSRELRATQEELAKSVAAAKHQTFEATFFQMLRLHHDVVSNVTTESTFRAVPQGAQLILTGRPAFKRFCEVLDDHLDIKTLTEDRDEEKSDAEMAAETKENIAYSWLAFFAASHDELSHYFRQLYNILLFIDSSEVISDKSQYSRILRAQLSLYELKLLFYNGLAKKNAPFKALAEKYALFEQISLVPYSKANQGRISRNHYQFYGRSAYGDWTPPEPSYDKDAWKESMKAIEKEGKDFKGDGD